jgi:hypothetical protein
MSILKLKANVTLCRSEDGFSIEVETRDHQSAMLRLAGHGPWVDAILRQWAIERVNEALVNGRRNTGLKDVTGTPVFEGDIVERCDLPGHVDVFAVVKWDPSRAAFIMEGQWPDGQIWQSENLNAVRAARIVGNVFQHPDRFKPCKTLGDQ